MAQPEANRPQDDNLATRHIAWAGAAIGGTVLGVIAVVLLWTHERHMAPGGERLARPYVVHLPGPALQSAPQLDLKAYRAEKRVWLQGLAWVDGEHRIARIPIDDAMALLAAQATSAAASGAAR
jgi:hypothetical protein